MSVCRNLFAGIRLEENRGREGVGYKLCQLIDTGGALRDISAGGFVAERELFHQLCAFLAGLESK